jgi:acetyl esterase/lipase
MQKPAAVPIRASFPHVFSPHPPAAAPGLLRRRALLGAGLALAALPGCGARLSAEVEGLPPGSPIVLSGVQEYGPAERHRLQVYSPADALAEARLPVIVLFHGGFWQMSDMDEGQMHGLARRLAARGAVVVMANYRLHPEVTFPGFVEDGARAVAWAARHAPRYGGCAGRLFTAGHSAGGHIAVMLGVDPRFMAPHGIRLAGAAGIAGPYGTWFQDHPIVGGVFPEALREASSPIALASAQSVPLLLLGARLDWLVRPSDATDLAARVREAGGVATGHIFEMATHTTIMSGLVPVADHMMRFVEAVAPGPATLARGRLARLV